MRNKKKGLGALLIAAGVLIAVSFCSYLLFQVSQKVLYPLKYEDMIFEYSEEYGISEELVCAVIRTESGFDPDAESRVGARGLMQIMPKTGEWIAGKLGEETGDLFDPETSIRYGTYLLKILSDRFSDETCVIAAYNAGIGRVGKWLEDPEYSDGETLTKIPIDETSEYVRRVLVAREKYKSIYNIGNDK